MGKKDKRLTKQSGGNKKKGRNLEKCKKYRLYNMRERNRDRRVARILRGFRTMNLDRLSVSVEAT